MRVGLDNVGHRALDEGAGVVALAGEERLADEMRPRRPKCTDSPKYNTKCEIDRNEGGDGPVAVLDRLVDLLAPVHVMAIPLVVGRDEGVVLQHLVVSEEEPLKTTNLHPSCSEEGPLRMTKAGVSGLEELRRRFFSKAAVAFSCLLWLCERWGEPARAETTS